MTFSELAASPEMQDYLRLLTLNDLIRSCDVPSFREMMTGEIDAASRFTSALMRPIWTRMRGRIVRRATARKRRQDEELWLDLGGECG